MICTDNLIRMRGLKFPYNFTSVLDYFYGISARLFCYFTLLVLLLVDTVSCHTVHSLFRMHVLLNGRRSILLWVNKKFHQTISRITPYLRLLTISLRPNRAFIVAKLVLLNSLPIALNQLPTLDTFKSALNGHLGCVLTGG